MSSPKLFKITDGTGGMHIITEWVLFIICCVHSSMRMTHDNYVTTEKHFHLRQKIPSFCIHSFFVYTSNRHFIFLCRSSILGMKRLLCVRACVFAARCPTDSALGVTSKVNQNLFGSYFPELYTRASFQRLHNIKTVAYIHVHCDSHPHISIEN